MTRSGKVRDQVHTALEAAIGTTAALLRARELSDDPDFRAEAMEKAERAQLLGRHLADLERRVGVSLPPSADAP